MRYGKIISKVFDIFFCNNKYGSPLVLNLRLCRNFITSNRIFFLEIKFLT